MTRDAAMRVYEPIFSTMGKVAQTAGLFKAVALALAFWFTCPVPCRGAERGSYFKLENLGANGMLLGGVACKDIDGLKAALAKIPSGSRIVWASGCRVYETIPLGPNPRMSIDEFRKVCGMRGIDFNYSSGMAVRLIRKTFDVPEKFQRHVMESGSQARKYFMELGVQFPPGSYVLPIPAERKISVCNAEENVDLIGKILAN